MEDIQRTRDGKQVWQSWIIISLQLLKFKVLPENFVDAGRKCRDTVMSTTTRKSPYPNGLIASRHNETYKASNHVHPRSSPSRQHKRNLKAETLSSLSLKLINFIKLHCCRIVRFRCYTKNFYFLCECHLESDKAGPVIRILYLTYERCFSTLIINLCELFEKKNKIMQYYNEAWRLQRTTSKNDNWSWL